jgi:hypothetical protein
VEEDVRVSELRSGLSDERFEAFAQEVIWADCLEWPTENHRLQSSTVRERLEEKGVEVPDWAMHDVFEHLRGTMLRNLLGEPQNPDDHADVEAVRSHGGVTIYWVDPDLCAV